MVLAETSTSDGDDLGIIYVVVIMIMMMVIHDSIVNSDAVSCR